MSATVEDLLRASAMTYGHIQLFRDDAGWSVSVNHYRTPLPSPEDTFTMGIFADPVDGLRKALLEDDRRTRDLQRKYAATRESCGDCGRSVGVACGSIPSCDPVQVDLEDYIAATPVDPMSGMFG